MASRCRFLLLPCALTVLSSGVAHSAPHEIDVIKSYAACKDPSNVQKFEDFERDDDDQGYKKLWLSTSLSGECIFLRAREIVLTLDETNGRFTCIFTYDPEARS